MGKIVVYADKGVDGGALKHLYRSLQLDVDETQCSLVRMRALELLREPWEETARLLIIPGGRDIFYHDALDGAGTERIRRYIEQGGGYLGICAGAYFACAGIEFEKGGSLEVCAPRSLNLFPGIAKGPAYGPGKYSYENCRGVEAARVSSAVGPCSIYFNGGCLFESSTPVPSTQVIGRYLDLPGAPAAALEIALGRGRAILSGVHIEYLPHLLDGSDPFLAPLIPELIQAEPLRRALFRSYLVRFDIPLTH